MYTCVYLQPVHGPADGKFRLRLSTLAQRGRENLGSHVLAPKELHDLGHISDAVLNIFDENALSLGIDALSLERNTYTCFSQRNTTKSVTA